ncbi:hypothetical protein PENPOL_c007G01709 [Penicillium polonicum]|uniref:Uncharacterized protein n=1 Tax=Penicillium polonicum TaxID=60169 RepID=A0A1V6NIK3_PENPO|nr:hypothetical protein PENPOL_c007G01709 [Penicillium polonicum]
MGLDNPSMACCAPGSSVQPSSSSSASSSIGPSIDIATITIVTLDVNRPGHHKNTYKRLFAPHNKQFATNAVKYLSYDLHGQVFLYSTHTSKIFSTTRFAEPKLSELVSTLTGESNFASWSTVLKWALDTRDPYIFKILTGYTQSSPLPRTPPFQSRLVSLAAFFPTFTLQFTRLLGLTLTPL